MRAHEFINEIYDRNDPGMVYDVMKYSTTDPNPHDSSKSFFNPIKFTDDAINFHDQIEFLSNNFNTPPNVIFNNEQDYDEILNIVLDMLDTVNAKIPDCYTAKNICKILLKYLQYKGYDFIK